MSRENDPSRVWRLFLSRTFRDTRAESEHLAMYVFPRLQAQMRQRGHDFAATDLGWGMAPIDRSTLLNPKRMKKIEEEFDRSVLKLCATEIENAGSLFFVILGDRYGWRPPLRLTKEVRKARGLTSNRECSVTELETEIAAQLEANVGMRTLVMLREPLPYDKMSREWARLYREEDRGQRSRLARLKAALIDRYPDRVLRYTAGWEASSETLTGLEAFGELAYSGLLRLMDD